MRLALILLGFSLALTSFAADIFVTSEGAGNKTGENWSNALNGSLGGYPLAVKTAIDNAVAGGADEVNVYFAGGDYSITQQLSLASILIPVKLSGGYLAEADGSLEKGETATKFTRTANEVRHISANSLSALRIEGITFINGYISEGGTKNSHVALGPKGGAIASAASTTVISNCVFRNNSFANATRDNRTGYASYLGGGGAVAAITSGSLDLDNCVFEGNHHVKGGTSNQSCGGAILGYKVGVNVRNCMFTGNYMDGSDGVNTLFGAAIGTYYGNVSISNCTFTGNYIKGAMYTLGGSFGGALAIRDATTFRMSDSVFTGNYVANKTDLIKNFTAGIVFLDDWNAGDGITTSCVERCVFDSRNVANSVKSTRGNATLYPQSDFLVSGGSLFMTNCLVFAACGGDTYGGYSIRCLGGSSSSSGSFHGYIYSSWNSAPSSMELVNCTIADGKYGAVADGGAEMTLKNCISYGHSVSGVVNATSVEYCCLQEEHEGEGNFVPPRARRS